MSDELPSRYQPKESEINRYQWWEQSGFFKPQSDAGKKTGMPYVIVIPPPNVTGILHMGHALNNSIQDILIRFQRMNGRDTLWIPGVDHAGIATQNVVEKKLAKEKKKRQDLGREKFLEEVWRWKEEHGNTITSQLRRLGASCDWSREHFTMDQGLSSAVREAFVTLFERGLIYRGNYIINWCPRCQTALSDEEAAHQEVQGGLYHLKYPLAGKGNSCEILGEDHVVVATTRPETFLGDVAIAINPKDERYQHLLGKKAILPILKREIPIIADDWVDPEFGTGFVKVTPAHDPNDFEIGFRHQLPQINVMHPDGKMNELAGPYAGMDRFDARKKIVADLEAEGLFVKKDIHKHAVGHCYRCNTVVEPYLSKQWFVKMKPLADKALKAHRQGKTVFYPDRWTKVYLNWLEGIRDWCISRQIWWGHQIPVWYDEAGDFYVARSEKEALQMAQSKRGRDVSLRQDPDVLDTWFSSWLWPFSTLGWPENTKDLKHFYPTSDLSTAPEIIFFWVARMIMAGLEFCGEVPFKNIYIHGTVRAANGQKMSKSLGNAIDPIEIIDEMGADALRMSLVMLSSQDVYLSREKFEMGRNFTNKIWNASRFVLMNLEGFQKAEKNLSFDRKDLPLSCRWILSKLQKTYELVPEQVKDFNLSEAASSIYHFIWNDFCDWFIELAKPTLQSSDSKEKEKIRAVLFVALEKSLRLLHPWMPFVTEEIWQALKKIATDQSSWPESISVDHWPAAQEKEFYDAEAEEVLGRVQEAVTAVRDLRMRLSMQPSEQLEIAIASENKDVLKSFEPFIPQLKVLGKLKHIEFRQEGVIKEKGWLGKVCLHFRVFVRFEGALDIEKEKAKLIKQIEETQRWIDGLNKKLENKDFAKNAPKDVYQKEMLKRNDAELLLKSQKELFDLFSNAG